MAIAPGGKRTISVEDWIVICIRLCRAPRLGIIIWLRSNGATSPCDAIEDKRETAFSLNFRSRYGVAGGAGEWWCCWRCRAWNESSKSQIRSQQMFMVNCRDFIFSRSTIRNHVCGYCSTFLPVWLSQTWHLSFSQLCLDHTNHIFSESTWQPLSTDPPTTHSPPTQAHRHTVGR